MSIEYDKMALGKPRAKHPSKQTAIHDDNDNDNPTTHKIKAHK